MLAQRRSAAGARVVCFDFRGLEGQKDIAAAALKLCIYQIRRYSERLWERERARTILVLDESWALIDAGTGGAATAAAGASFLASSIRMGRKSGLGVIALSQQIQDFVSCAYGAAVVGNAATRLIGQVGGDVEGLREHLNLTGRQVEQLRALRRTPAWHEFLLIRGGTYTDVVRVPADPFSRWTFTTKPDDLVRIDEIAKQHPDLSLFERTLLLAGGSSCA